MTIEGVLGGEQRYHVATCRAEELLDALPDGCVSLIVTDPPYYRVKDEAWDRAWPDEAAFLAWMGSILDRFRGVLAPNGSLYIFASPDMAWGVEGEVRRRFRMLSNIRWQKPPHSTKAEMFRKEDLRAPFPASETVIFAEQVGVEAMIEPIRAYLDGERERAGVSRVECNSSCGFVAKPGGMASRHYFSPSQFWLPTPAHYDRLRARFNAEPGGPYLTRSYEDLRRQYEDLRRPFTVSADVPYTDVWEYETVQRYDGKHPCEKPWQMGLDIVSASSRPGDVVLDVFAGSGTFPAAAVALGRRVIACDMDPHWSAFTERRIVKVIATGDGRVRRAPRSASGQGSLFGDGR